MSEQIFENREMSWLKFNERVLEEAKDSKNPLCERLSFLGIFQSNFDEFIQVRVGALIDGIKTGASDNKTGLSCSEQVLMIREKQRELLKEKDKVYSNLIKKTGEYGVKNLTFSELSENEKSKMTEFFGNNILPFLSPQIVGKRQPFPFLRNKEIYAVVELDAKNGTKIGIIPCFSTVLNRIIPVSEDSKKFMLLEELILHFASEIFCHYQVKAKSLIRILRSADIDLDELEDDNEDYRSAVEEALKIRTKLNPVELDYTRTLDDSVINKMCEFLGLQKNQTFHFETPFNLGFLNDIRDILRNEKELFYSRRIPQNSPMFDLEKSVINQIKQSDKILYYPYENIKPFLQFLNEAANSTEVVSIKMTLYRVAPNSKIVESLIEAAENGKEVVVLVELRARFDEENNIRWSFQLEEAGCHVIYGLNHLKVHSKLCLVTLKNEGKIGYITQIGTGNYNEKTSKIYTDYSLMTANENIGCEAAKVFNSLSFGETVENTEFLLVAPNSLQNKILQMIDEQEKITLNGGEGYIGLKINSLTDKVIIDRLVKASKSGVKIQMVVRGICCLKAGIKGETENIEVRSIVGRFLEHSRIYIFGKGESQKVYIASADFMTRNTTHRVEVASPVYDSKIKKRIIEDFETFLADNVKARIQTKGIYVHAKPKKEESLMNAQEFFYERAYKNSKPQT